MTASKRSRAHKRRRAAAAALKTLGVEPSQGPREGKPELYSPDEVRRWIEKSNQDRLNRLAFAKLAHPWQKP